MSDDEAELVFEAVLDAPLEKIWRALTIPEYRDRWLQKPDNVDVALDMANDNNVLTYRWAERRSGDENSTEVSRVTIELTPNADGTTGFRLTHAPPVLLAAANGNAAAPTMLRAA